METIHLGREKIYFGLQILFMIRQAHCYYPFDSGAVRDPEPTVPRWDFQVLGPWNLAHWVRRTLATKSGILNSLTKINMVEERNQLLQLVSSHLQILHGTNILSLSLRALWKKFWVRDRDFSLWAYRNNREATVRTWVKQYFRKESWVWRSSVEWHR